MAADKTKKNTSKQHKAPILSRHIDKLREKEGHTITHFTKVAMGINRDIYRRRMDSVDGFTERELVSACMYLGCSITIQNVVVGSLVTSDHETGDFAEVIPSNGGKGWKERLKSKK